MMKLLLALVLLSIFLLTAFVLTAKTDCQVLTVGGATFKVDIAATPKSREQGLSGRQNLGDTEGMLFVFDKPGQYENRIWMKDMLFPIDAIWLDGNLTVVDITRGLTPASYPETFQPKIDAKYLLETDTGFVDRHAVSEGIRFGNPCL